MSRERNPKFEWQDQFARAGYRGAALAVGTWIGNHWNGDNRHPLAPVDLLMSETRYSRRSVTLALATLRRDGWIAQATRGGRRGNDGTAWASRYRLTIPVPNVQSAAAQCATGCTHVDQTVLDQTTPPSRTFVDQESGVPYEEEQRRLRKWLACPTYPWDVPYEDRPTACSHCEPNDGCAVKMREAGML